MKEPFTCLTCSSTSRARPSNSVESRLTFASISAAYARSASARAHSAAQAPRSKVSCDSDVRGHQLGHVKGGLGATALTPAEWAIPWECKWGEARAQEAGSKSSNRSLAQV
jgi:hypothetical protein